jgi:type I restriction enzyme S subunit
MNTRYAKKLLLSMAKGAVGQANINAKELQDIAIIIPPIDIQRDFLGLIQQSDKSKLMAFHANSITTRLSMQISSTQ